MTALAFDVPVVVGARPASAAPAPFIFVTNNFGQSVTAYAPGSNGNSAPIATISGGNTGINGPNGVAVESDGTIVVSNSGNSSITFYAAGANGNVAPIRTIAGNNTGLATPRQLTLDS